MSDRFLYLFIFFFPAFSCSLSLQTRLCWELLGDAYIGRGSFVAALKAFKQALEIEPSAVYCQYRIGMIHHVLGNLAESVQCHRDVIARAPRYFSALFDLAETLYTMAQQYLDFGQTLRAATCVEEAISSLDQALSITSAYKCVWKLLGDLCTFAHFLPSSAVAAIVIGPNLTALQNESYNASAVGVPSSSPMSSVHLLQIGALCFRKYIALEESSAVLCDLSANLLYQGGATKNETLTQTAVEVAQRAVALQPTDSNAWITLGSVCTAAKVRIALE